MDEKQIIQVVKNDLSWLQKHERIVLVALVLAVTLFIGNKTINYMADRAHQQADLAHQQLEDQKKANADTAKAVAAATTQYQSMVDTLTAQNASLASAVAQRNQNLVQQQQSNQTLPLPALAQRWANLAGLQPGDLTATASGIATTDGAARSTVNQLEKVPVLEANLRDQTQVANNKQNELDSANGLIQKQGDQVLGLQTQLKKQDDVCKADLKVARDEASKSKVRWFKAGVIVGFVTGLFAGHGG